MKRRAIPPAPCTLADLGERPLLARVRRWMAADGAGLLLGIGDDAALLTPPRGADPSLAVTTDALVEGVHFRRDWTAGRDLGHKALAVNLSDLAAMGARPVAAFLALSLPGATPLAEIEAFFKGVRAAGRAADCPLAGGDLTGAPQWVINITVLGRAAVCDPEGRPVFLRRTAARPGDWVYVTGRPGESGAGLAALQAGMAAPALIRRHVRPVPRLAEGEHLARLAAAGWRLAAMDVSDGIWDDASKLAEASGVRIELVRAALPLTGTLRRLGRQLRRDPLEWVLCGGEDYELLVVSGRPIEPGRDWPADLAPLHGIGRVRRGRGVRLLDAHGRPVAMEDRTFSHF